MADSDYPEFSIAAITSPYRARALSGPISGQ
jgi:hypothetical protein